MKEHTLSLQEVWASLSENERIDTFESLKRAEAEELFLNLSAPEQAELMAEYTPQERRSWLRLLAPDDTADLIQELPEDEQTPALNLLDNATKKEVMALLAYAEDDAGGLMSSQFIRLRPDMSVEEAIHYLRAQARTKIEIIYYAYVLNQSQKLLGVISFRELLLAPPGKKVSDIMKTSLLTLHENTDQEEVSQQFALHGLMAIPVVDQDNHMKGIITFDDVVDVVQEETTEDIQKLGGTEALGEPYLKIRLIDMIKKRAGWLTVLFIGEMFTATAMSFYEHEIEKAVVLALFIPLIISSGGNSGSQATTLIIRAMALREVRLQDWWRVLNRELICGLALGTILGTIGLIRILLWPTRSQLYTQFYPIVAATIAASLIGVVLWGSIAGSMLPFILKKFKFDPASASAPLVATLVDVTGLIIYFTVASLLLKGTLL